MDKKIGQMLLIGFRGKSPSAAIADDIQRGRVGGVILYDRDVLLNLPERNIQSKQQVQELTRSLQHCAEVPLFIAIDQEGGKVARLKEAHGFAPTLSPQYLGLLNDLELTRSQAHETAGMLKSLGININFAPVVDLNINPDNPVIGKLERSFSADAEIVIEHAAAVVTAHRDHGILTTLKHFPGHGSSRADSHQGFVDVTTTWCDYELLPYQELIEENLADCIMTAHVFNAHLDLYNPATLSRSTISGILRDRLGFKGIVVSDDMQMKAITNQFGLDTAIELAVNAGIDILVFGNNMTFDAEIAGKVKRIIKRLLKQKKISLEQIELSCERIVQYKQKWLLG